MKAKGLGDTIKSFTDLSGITSMVEYIEELTGVDCGCDKRKAWLNKQFPYKMFSNGSRNR